MLALVGAAGDDDIDGRAGAAYGFRREYVAAVDTFRWVEEAKLYPGLPIGGHQFGGAVALAADTLAGGTPAALALVGTKHKGIRRVFCGQ